MSGDINVGSLERNVAGIQELGREVSRDSISADLKSHADGEYYRKINELDEILSDAMESLAQPAQQIADSDSDHTAQSQIITRFQRYMKVTQESIQKQDHYYNFHQLTLYKFVSSIFGSAVFGFATCYYLWSYNLSPLPMAYLAVLCGTPSFLLAVLTYRREKHLRGLHFTRFLYVTLLSRACKEAKAYKDKINTSYRH